MRVYVSVHRGDPGLVYGVAADPMDFARDEDYWLPFEDGLELFGEIKENAEELAEFELIAKRVKPKSAKAKAKPRKKGSRASGEGGGKT